MSEPLNLMDSNKVDTIPIKEIYVVDRVREEMGNMELQEQSIKDKGLIVPITVKYFTQKEGFKYKLLAGGRRLTVCKKLGKAHIPARIYPEEITPLIEKEIELFENLHRENLSPYELTKIRKEIVLLQQAKHGEKRIPTDPNDPGVSIRDIAKMLGVSKSSLAEDIKLFDVMEAIPELKDAKTKSELKQRVAKLQRKFSEDKSLKKMEDKKKRGEITEEQQEITNWYITGNVYKEFPKVVDGSLDLVEIDPPYGIDLEAVKKGGDTVTEDYNEVSVDEFKKLFKFTVETAYKKMRKNSWLLTWFAPEPFFEFCYQTCIDAGFTGRRLCGEWVKTNGQTNQPSHYLANASEWFFYFAKGKPEIRRPGRLNIFDYKGIEPSQKVHPTERPVELMSDILTTFALPGSLLAVPFAGSGNTLLAAANNRMIAFGYDLAVNYKKSYLVKIYRGTHGEYKSYWDKPKV